LGSRSAKEIWETAKGALQIQVNKANYETWLKDTLGLSYKDNQFVVGTPSAFASEWLEKRLQSLIKKTLISITGEKVEVQFQVYSNQLDAPRVPDPYRASSVERPLCSKPNPRYNFDNFVVGRCNRIAYAAAMGVAEEPGRKFNPLFIYGGPGLGKTHLVFAIGNAASENGFKVLYTSAEQFTNEFISTIKEKKTAEFRHKFRNVDILLLDDIHFIAGKPQTQEVLFHTFNELHNANRQLVITSDRPPRSLALMETRLSSRFEWGVITSIQFPDLDTRLAILKSKADLLKIRFDKTILELIARRCHKNIRQLEGTLNNIIARSKIMGERPTLELVEKALEETTDEKHVTPSKLTPELILDTVASYFNLSTDSLKSKKRDRKTALARQISIYLIREKSDCSLKVIGNILGGRDHSTVLHGHQNINTQLIANPELQKEVDNIINRLQS